MLGETYLLYVIVANFMNLRGKRELDEIIEDIPTSINMGISELKITWNK